MVGIKRPFKQAGETLKEPDSVVPLTRAVILCKAGGGRMAVRAAAALVLKPLSGIWGISQTKVCGVPGPGPDPAFGVGSGPGPRFYHPTWAQRTQAPALHPR